MENKITFSNTKEIRFEGPATYEIVVQGEVSPDWSDYLAGLEISTIKPKNGPSQRTSLVGRIRDQAQLSGVLDTLYNLHLTILKVERLED